MRSYITYILAEVIHPTTVSTGDSLNGLPTGHSLNWFPIGHSLNWLQRRYDHTLATPSKTVYIFTISFLSEIKNNENMNKIILQYVRKQNGLSFLSSKLRVRRDFVPGPS